MSQVRGEGRGSGHSVFTAILPYMDQVPIYNGYNFWLENYDVTNQTDVRSRVSTFLCPDNANAENVAAIDVRFPDSRSSFAKTHYGANWGGGRGLRAEAGSSYHRTPPQGGIRGPWGDNFAIERGTYLGVMMTVITPDGQVKARCRDGQPKARIIGLNDITDGRHSPSHSSRSRDSFGWAVGGWGGSEFDVHTSPSYNGDDALARKVYSGSVHIAGPNALLCDASVRALRPKQDRALWYALITRAGGEAIKFEN